MQELKKLFVWVVAIALVIAFVPVLWGTEEGHKGQHEEQATQAASVNINKASAEELTQLKGVGEKYAEAIVHYREEHGLFKQAEDIMKVPGIGPKTFETNKERITVE